MKLAVIAVAILPLFILGLTAVAGVTDAGAFGTTRQGVARLQRNPLWLFERCREQRLRVRRG